MPSANIDYDQDDERNMDIYGDGEFTDAFFKTLMRVQNNVVNLPGQKEHFDIYLAKKIYPVLVPGLEALSKEVERLMQDDGKIDSAIKERFNPCIFLAEYLMSNNPKFGHQKEYTDIFEKYARIERNRRFWSEQRQVFLKEFMGQSYQSNFTLQHLGEFVELIDKYLDAQGAIKDATDVKSLFSFLDEDEVISFDKFYEIFTRNLLDTVTIDYEKVIETAEDQKKKREIEKFKKKTDRLI
eukprot:CAMPEP_0205805042 /NCGR_PEP_ID=MMETSP0205-20121125/8142_1 /ASSEMBLY_ACC=CAM_ASM_000278 /TAXON_ID=36767 /ORGANISM="Euplotes focardii, Strain TN1" /LENGTH=239 /DNA_ID=CAMNT_0053075617 /DNA_START=50 /DNA_END=766 /DNA_ORIENTATION=-